MDGLVRLDVHGLRVAIGGDWTEVVQDLRLDFDWFVDREPTSPDVSVTGCRPAA